MGAPDPSNFLKTCFASNKVGKQFIDMFLLKWTGSNCLMLFSGAWISSCKYPTQLISQSSESISLTQFEMLCSELASRDVRLTTVRLLSDKEASLRSLSKDVAYTVVAMELSSIALSKPEPMPPLAPTIAIFNSVHSGNPDRYPRA